VPEDLPHVGQVKRLSKKLDDRIAQHNKVLPYVEGPCPTPDAVQKARLTKVYEYLMPISAAPWGSLINDSKLDRMEVAGLRDTDENAAERIWGEVWQPNDMDAETKLAHSASLLDGRCFGTVWPGEDGTPDIALDDCTQMVVEYRSGSRKYRTAALRRWQEGDQLFATLYRPEGVYKFQGPPSSGKASPSTTEWEKRVVDGEDWPLANPFDSRIPVVELAVNRKLKSGAFPYARGEFEHCLGLLDRINLLTFLGLIVAFWMGFPMRGVLGETIRREVLKDDDGNPLIDEATGKEKTKAKPPFDVDPGSIFQMENPEAKLAEFKAADRSNLSIYDEFQQLAVITKTPRHYFPMEGAIANIATETVAAFEGAMIAAVSGHTATLGGGWEEICRLGGMVLDEPVELSQQAEMRWKNPEFRTLAEVADAVSKLKEVLPWVAIAEYALNASQEEISRWQAMRASDPLNELLAQTKQGFNGSGDGRAPVPTG
jgi:hypothetical protein